MTEQQVNVLIEKAKPYIGRQINVFFDQSQLGSLFTFSRIGNKVGLSENGNKMSFSVSGVLTNDTHKDIVDSLNRIVDWFESH